MSLRFRFVVVLLATLTLLLTSCDGGEQQLADVPDEDPTATATVPENAATQDPAEQGEFEATLRVLNQLGDGERVAISRATTDGSFRALAVVHEDEDGAPGRPLGFVQVDQAQAGGVTVELDEPIAEGSHRLWVVMHVDADPEGEFDPGSDEVLTVDGEPLSVEFTYTVTSS